MCAICKFRVRLVVTLLRCIDRRCMFVVYGPVVQQLQAMSVRRVFKTPFAESNKRHISSISACVLVKELPSNVTVVNFDFRPACSLANEFVGNFPVSLLLSWVEVIR